MGVKLSSQEILSLRVPFLTSKQSEENSSRSTNRNRHACLALVGVAALWYLYLGLESRFRTPNNTTAVSIAASHTSSVTKEGSWNWAGVEPSRDLKWHECYDDAFTCARLDVSSPATSKRIRLKRKHRCLLTGSTPQRKSVLLSQLFDSRLRPKWTTKVRFLSILEYEPFAPHSTIMY